MESEELQLRDLAIELAEEAGRALQMMPISRVWTKTSPTDPATDADNASEKLIYQKLLKLRPDDEIIAEEGSGKTGTSGVTWVIDPLDGTVNYVYGIPHWCVSIGVEGRYRFGVIHDPNRQETFANPKKMTPSGNTDLADSLIGTGFSYSAEMRAQQAEVLRRLLPRVRDIRRAGSCALDLAWVACGRLDAYYERDVKRWDTSAGLSLVEAAGGATAVHGDTTMAAGTAELLAGLEDLIL